MSNARDLFRKHRWWITRIAILPLHLLVFAVVVFFLVRALPGDPVMSMTEGELTEGQYEKVEEALGLSGSTAEQLRTFLGNVVTLDLGESIYTGRSVTSEFRDRVPATMELALLGLTGTVTAAMVGAYVVVMRPRSIPARILRVYTRTAGAVPFFVLAVIGIYVFYARLRWAPAPIGRIDSSLSMPDRLTGFPLLDSVLRGKFDVTRDMAAHLVLPVGALVIAQADVLMKLLVSGLEEAVDAPQTRFRVASGANRRTVVLSVYRRALPAMVTMSGTMFGYLIGGAVVLESLFGLGALGRYAVEAVTSKDIVALQGFLLVAAAMALLVFMLVDLVNMFLDPRRRPGVRTEVAN